MCASTPASAQGDEICRPLRSHDRQADRLGRGPRRGAARLRARWPALQIAGLRQQSSTSCKCDRSAIRPSRPASSTPTSSSATAPTLLPPLPAAPTRRLGHRGPAPILLDRQDAARRAGARDTGDPWSPWSSADGWRLNVRGPRRDPAPQRRRGASGSASPTAAAATASTCRPGADCVRGERLADGDVRARHRRPPRHRHAWSRDRRHAHGLHGRRHAPSSSWSTRWPRRTESTAAPGRPVGAHARQGHPGRAKAGDEVKRGATPAGVWKP